MILKSWYYKHYKNFAEGLQDCDKQWLFLRKIPYIRKLKLIIPFHEKTISGYTDFYYNYFIFTN